LCFFLRFFFHLNALNVISLLVGCERGMSPRFVCLNYRIPLCLGFLLLFFFVYFLFIISSFFLCLKSCSYRVFDFVSSLLYRSFAFTWNVRFFPSILFQGVYFPCHFFVFFSFLELTFNQEVCLSVHVKLHGGNIFLPLMLPK